MSMQTEVQILDGTPTSVWNGSEWVPYVDPRELRPFVLDRRSDRRVLLPLVTVVVTRDDVPAVWSVPADVDKLPNISTSNPKAAPDSPPSSPPKSKTR